MQMMNLLHLKKFFWPALEDNIYSGVAPNPRVMQFILSHQKKLIKIETTPSIDDRPCAFMLRKKSYDYKM